MLGILRRACYSTDFSSLARMVMQRNPSIKSSELIMSGLQRLSSLETKTQLWIEPVCASPSLLDFREKDLESVTSSFYRFGVSKAATWFTLGAHPELIEMPRASLNLRLNQVEGLSRSLNVSLETLLGISSHILFLDGEEIGARLGDLKEFFTKSQVHDLVLKSPLVMYEDISVLRSRLKYLLDVMHVHPLDIIHASPEAFIIDSEELCIRYEFLQRSGLYKHPDPKGVEEGLHALPPLKEIVLHSQEDFLRRGANDLLTQEELTTFAKAMNNEKSEFSGHFDVLGHEDEEYMDEIMEEEEFDANVKHKSRKRKKYT
eukprot:TRINITY_DN25151_c0_g1_i1.p2 TRINITY_DN25151_c0_g1~~TRINITY_DN25151_c0_g1_i1.p2  ORF type:complete len:317 (-),score=71.07 TRINITY_DN25151_c0_g1_i1:1005-1955(-)